MSGKLGNVSMSIALMVPMVALVMALLQVSGRAPATESHSEAARGDLQQQSPSSEIRDFPQLD
jgi:hypothetical protein